jgi:ribonuclease HI
MDGRRLVPVATMGRDDGGPAVVVPAVVVAPRQWNRHAYLMTRRTTAVDPSQGSLLYDEPTTADEPDPGRGDGSVTEVYTDGACRGNPGPGGWAWAVDGGPYGSGSEPHTTNQRMEVLAVIEALRSLPGPVHVVSDSTYVVNCFRQKWWAGWRRRGWRNSQGKPVANRDLWESLLALALDDSRSVTFSWVKGHSGDKMNDLVDRLATEAADRQ